VMVYLLLSSARLVALFLASDFYVYYIQFGRGVTRHAFFDARIIVVFGAFPPSTHTVPIRLTTARRVIAFNRQVKVNGFRRRIVGNEKNAAMTSAKE
jgi:hypothetical protein